MTLGYCGPSAAEATTSAAANTARRSTFRSTSNAANAALPGATGARVIERWRSYCFLAGEAHPASKATVAASHSPVGTNLLEAPERIAVSSASQGASYAQHPIQRQRYKARWQFERPYSAPEHDQPETPPRSAQSTELEISNWVEELLCNAWACGGVSPLGRLHRRCSRAVA